MGARDRRRYVLITGETLGPASTKRYAVRLRGGITEITACMRRISRGPDQRLENPIVGKSTTAASGGGPGQ